MPYLFIDEKATLKHTLFHDHCYIVPRNNGRLVIGATMIENDWNERVSLSGIESLIAKAKTMLPAVSDMKIDSFWAGFVRKPLIKSHLSDTILKKKEFYLLQGIIVMGSCLLLQQDK